MTGSESLWKEEDLLTQLEQQQDEIEELTSQIQMLSSAKQRLESVVQTQSKKIASQAEKIAKLSDSDRQLQRAAEQMKNAEKLKRDAREEAREAEATIEAYKAELKKLMSTKNEAERLVREREQEIIDEAKACAKPVLHRLRASYADDKAKMREEYNSRIESMKKALRILIVYAVAVTILWLYR